MNDFILYMKQWAMQLSKLNPMSLQLDKNEKKKNQSYIYIYIQKMVNNVPQKFGRIICGGCQKGVPKNQSCGRTEQRKQEEPHHGHTHQRFRGTLRHSQLYQPLQTSPKTKHSLFCKKLVVWILNETLQSLALLLPFFPSTHTHTHTKHSANWLQR